MKNNKYLNFIKELYCRVLDDEIDALAAQLTYYLLLSIFPFLIFLITLISYTPMTSEQALFSLSEYLPKDVYKIVIDTIYQTLKSRSGALLSIGMIATLWTASNGLSALMRGINKAYDQKESRPYWKVKYISLIFTIGLALVLLFSLFLVIFGEVIANNIFSYFGVPDVFRKIWTALRFFLPIITSIIVFIILYYFTPNRRISIKSVIPGSLFSSLGWILISLPFSVYVNNFSNFSRMYGSLGGIIVLLVWLYWCSIIILIGGEINAILHFGQYKKCPPKCEHLDYILGIFKRKS